MLSMSDIDQLENYLFNAKLDDVPKVFGRVLPLIFSELRVMSIALDKQAQEFFFNERQVGNGTNGSSSDHHDDAGRPNLLGNPSPVQAPADSRFAAAVAAAQPQGNGVDAQPGGVQATQGGSSPGVGAGNVGEEVGGEVRKRKRGRPPKRSQQVDAVLTMEPSPRLMEGQ